MNVTRMKEDITALTFEVFKKSGLTMKFKVKTYFDENWNTKDVFYHKEYVYSLNGKRGATIAITPKSYIQLDVLTDTSKNSFYMSEVLKSKFIRQTGKIVALLEAYDSEEIDIIKVDASGTHISKNFPNHVKIKLGKSIIEVSVVMREEKNDVGVSIKFDNSYGVVLAIYDFLDLFYRLKDFNYLSMTMQLINYLGCPTLGKHETDFREPGVLDAGYDDTPGGSSPYNAMSPFSGISRQRKNVATSNKINW